MTTDAEHQAQKHHRRAIEVAEQYNTTSVTERHERERILKKMLGTAGEGVEIHAPFHCENGSQIHIGARTAISFNCVVIDAAAVTIGEDVQIGPNVQLLTVNPPPGEAKPIVIGNHAWLGGGAIIGPGVTIGERAVVCAGAVVMEDVAPNTTVAGNPARVVTRRGIEPRSGV